MFQATYISHTLRFKRPAGTSRGVLKTKPCWYLILRDDLGNTGYGEVSLIPGLSLEDPDELEIRLDHICKLISRGEMSPDQSLPALPGIRFALETARADLQSGGKQVLFPSDFTRGLEGIPINGLIWMGDRESMLRQIEEKIQLGFRVLKMKVGALEHRVELEVVGSIRERFGPADLELRLDANGAWSEEEALQKIGQFAAHGIHSLEQPVPAGNPESMARTCRGSEIPVALDEELIGVLEPEKKRALIETIRPTYLILKPGLLGGFRACEEWIGLAGELDTGWWITSALESDLGLNAIAQWTYSLGLDLPQGLGTGQLFTNNLPSPLTIRGEQLWHLPDNPWNLQIFRGS